MNHLRFLLATALIVILVPSEVRGVRLIGQTNPPVVSFRHTRLNGVGLGVQGRHLSLSLFWIQNCDHSSGSLLYVSGEGWVRVRRGRLFELNFLMPAKLFDFCIGTNYLTLPDENHFGYQLGIQKWINEFALIRLGLRRVGLADSIFINIGLDLPALMKEAKGG